MQGWHNFCNSVTFKNFPYNQNTVLLNSITLHESIWNCGAYLLVHSLNINKRIWDIGRTDKCKAEEKTAKKLGIMVSLYSLHASMNEIESGQFKD